MTTPKDQPSKEELAEQCKSGCLYDAICEGSAEWENLYRETAAIKKAYEGKLLRQNEKIKSCESRLSALEQENERLREALGHKEKELD